MQERKKYTIELTAGQAEKMQQIINMIDPANDVKFEEVEEEIDEREEAIKSIECMVERCTIGCTKEDCNMCEFNTHISEIKVRQIAIKHIQGYKVVMEWLDKAIREYGDNPIVSTSILNLYFKFKEKMEKEFDINSEVK